jgi:hypothetical protein
MRTFGLLALSLAACGGTQAAPAEEPTAESAVEAEEQDGMQIQGITGSYGHDVVVSLQDERQDDMLDCYAHALSERAYAYGRIVIAVHVSAEGQVRWAYAKETDLGHRGAEKCMVDRIARSHFPPPQGNADAEVSFSYQFDPAGRPAEPEEAERLGEVVASHRTEVDGCTGGRSGFTLTVYADRQGAITAAGVSTPDAAAAGAADCLAEAAKGWTLPAAGSWFAKLSVAL